MKYHHLWGILSFCYAHYILFLKKIQNYSSNYLMRYSNEYLQ